MFHVDKYNPYPVRLNLVSGDVAREVIYSARDFAYDGVALAGELPSDLGYSGFRVMHGAGKDTDWLAFQGATYFRSSGEDDQYGISARGLAVNTALPPAEEFPRFVEFWLAETADDPNAITVFALMDSPSLTGAYRFTALKNRGATDRGDGGAVRAHGDRAPRHCAADEHVLVRRERAAPGKRLAPGNPRQRRAGDLDGIAASTSGGRSSIRLPCAPTRSWM